MSVIFSAALLGLGYIASAARQIGELVPRHDRFELSQDGESLRCGELCYSFVGFCDCDDYSGLIGETAKTGRRIGYLADDEDRWVWRIDCEEGDYLLLRGSFGSDEIYRLSR